MDFGFSPEIVKKLLYICVVILSAVIVSAIIKSFIRVPERLQNRRQRTFASILKNLITVVVYVIALHVILGILSINLAPLLASAGIIGLSIGLGARPLIEDLIGGMTLLSQDTISIGDNVEIDGSTGRITNIGFRTLTIRAKDGSLHVIPNGMVKKVINFSRKSHVAKKK